MASYEVSNLQANDLFGQEQELQKVRTGKKRMSTFAIALAKPPSRSEADLSPYRDPNSSKNKSKGAGGGAGGGLAKLMGKSSSHKNKKVHGEDRSEKVWPAERARDNRNSMLRSKLKAGREKMRAEEEERRFENLTIDERSSELIEEENREREREDAERAIHEREAREHAAASARIAERNIEVAARRQRLLGLETDHRTGQGNAEPLLGQESQYDKWSKFYDHDKSSML